MSFVSFYGFRFFCGYLLLSLYRASITYSSKLLSMLSSIRGGECTVNKLYIWILQNIRLGRTKSRKVWNFIATKYIDAQILKLFRERNPVWYTCYFRCVYIYISGFIIQITTNWINMWIRSAISRISLKNVHRLSVSPLIWFEPEWN